MSTTSANVAASTKLEPEPDSTAKVSVGRQVLRRELNNRVAVRDRGAGELHVLCECGRSGCRDALLVERDVYERLRRVPTHFLSKREHAAGAERVVETCGDFVIVEKFGSSGLAAVRLARETSGR